MRGMLLFAKGKRLGPDGLDWMKIHIVNLTGLKKRYIAKQACFSVHKFENCSVFRDILKQNDSHFQI